MNEASPKHAENEAPVDWSTVDQYPENECRCACGAFFHSHSKFVSTTRKVDSGFPVGSSEHIACIQVAGLVSRKPCPTCGSHSIRSSRSGWELMTIGSAK